MHPVTSHVQVYFEGIPSTFEKLSVQADNGVVIEADLTATDGTLFIDGDMENSSSADGANFIQFQDQATMTANGLLFLQARTGVMTSSGSITLLAGSGIVINTDAVQTGNITDSLVTINADFESPGFYDPNVNDFTGVFTIQTGKTLTTDNGDMIVTAWDLDLDGGFNTGEGTLFLMGAKAGQTIGLGGVPKNMHISSSELGRLSGDGLSIGSHMVTYDIFVDGVTEAESELVTLIATMQYAKIVFEGAPSTFRGLTAKADDGVIVRTTVSTRSVGMHLDGDAEDSLAIDLNNKVGFTDGLTTTAKTLMTLEATVGAIQRSGSMTLHAGSGIVLLNSLLPPPIIVGQTPVVVDGKPIVLNADYESYGDGTLTLADARTIVASDSDVVITAWDIDFQGTIATGTGTISLHGSQANQMIALGNTTAATGLSMHIEDTELGRITTNSGVRLASDEGGNVVVDGITAASSQNVGSLMSILALYDDAQVEFSGQGSTFNSLFVKADNGIIVKTGLTTDAGPLHLDGDADTSATSDNANSITFTYGGVLTSSTLLTLQSATGGILLGGTFTLRAGQGIVLLDDMLGISPGSLMTIYSDFESAGDGTLTVWTGKSLDSNNSDIVITAWDIDLQGYVITGTSGVTLHGAKIEQTLNLGLTAGDLHLDNTELQHISATGFSLGNTLSGNINVGGVTSASSDAVSSIMTIKAGLDDKKILFSGAASTFNSLAAGADNGIYVEVDLTTDTGTFTCLFIDCFVA